MAGNGRAPNTSERRDANTTTGGSAAAGTINAMTYFGVVKFWVDELGKGDSKGGRVVDRVGSCQAGLF